jgi:hypothetical protein
VQAIHAAHDAGRFFCTPTDPVPSVVVCQTPDESTLRHEAERLEARGVRVAVFTEPDRGNEATALATEPLGQDARRMFRKWKLLERSA